MSKYRSAVQAIREKVNSLKKKEIEVVYIDTDDELDDDDPDKIIIAIKRKYDK